MTGMRISTAKSEAMVFLLENGGLPTLGGGRITAPSKEVLVSWGPVHKRWEDGTLDGQAVWGSVCGNAGAAPDCCDEERA